MASDAEYQLTGSGSAGDDGTPNQHAAPAPRSDAEADEAALLQTFGAEVRDQDDLERDITAQASALLAEAEDKKDEQRIEKLEATRKSLESKRNIERQMLERERRVTFKANQRQKKIDQLSSEIDQVTSDIADFQQRMEKRRKEAVAAQSAAHKPGKLPGESDQTYLLRTGKITPFSNLDKPQLSALAGETADALADSTEDDPKSHQHLRRPGFAEQPKDMPTHIESEFSLRPRKKRKRDASVDEFEPVHEESSDSQYALDTSEEEATGRKRRKGAPAKGKKQKKAANAAESDTVDVVDVDDGDERRYKVRLNDWVERRDQARRRHAEATGSPFEETDEKEWFKPSPALPDYVFDNGLRLPGDIHRALFDYQKTGVNWMVQLWEQGVGGILADEMGLGKTGKITTCGRLVMVTDRNAVQIIALIAALHYSKKLTKPVLIVVPVTVLKQWVKEFHVWWPPLRVSILHEAGSGMANQREDDIDYDKHKVGSGKRAAARRIINRVLKDGHVLVTSYGGMAAHYENLTRHKWAYAILDEGVRIKNPDAKITSYCKNLETVNRIVMTGTPIQNNLIELWSLFDFAYPMRLGNLQNFKTQFDTPIRQGGYANASNLQVLAAAKCAEILKETMAPYMLQRLKKDVAADLPPKTERVMYVKLSPEQLDAYKAFLQSEAVEGMLIKSRDSLPGIRRLQNICNHPDIADDNDKLKNDPYYNWGDPNKSTKLALVKQLLEQWKRFGYKSLIFSQSKVLLDILEKMIRDMGNIQHVRMDGETPPARRQVIMDRFNNDPSIDVFVSTTKVGGVGTNLTGAQRIIIFDPDWNPANDSQARERAWRLGQTKPVTIYRLLTTDTIEDKIYHRQVFKTFLAHKVLNDPSQRANMDMSDLYDLFSFGKDKATNASADRSKVFEGAEVNFDGEAGKGNQEATSLQQLSALDKVEDYQEDPNAAEEMRMLNNIFSRTVDSAYEHDQVVGGKKRVQADRSMNEYEANKVAKEAAEHLRRAGEEARRIPSGTQTWTGLTGEGGKNPRRGGPSSSSVLDSLAARQSRNLGNSPANSKKELVLPPMPNSIFQPTQGAKSADAKISSVLPRRKGLNFPKYTSKVKPGSSRTDEQDGAGQGQSKPSIGVSVGREPRNIKGGPSSAQGTSKPNSGQSSRTVTPPSEKKELREQDFIVRIQDYLKQRGGKVAAESLRQRFHDKCRTDRAKEEFLSALGKVATSDQGTYTLKAKYAK
ncbi:DNA repair and recombination protein RAD26 [Colletotrichum spinosum]|uniref:DNA repair and recombination protein RAD26 n=1 Tax=Colletotrichum spinosum TaxID=1347390 RepID=A0A4R8QN56_9PEZI|nr:DNA repair and recombination protein RAD26 [Colletotrichum spinosum]